jgi:uncharacterized membrane protein
MSTLRRRLRCERGSVLIGGLLLSVALVMVIGLGVDYAHALLVRRQLTSIADDAALSGSQAIDIPELHAGHLELEPGQARSEALRTITANPSTRGEATATSGQVTVTVTRTVPTILLGIVGLHSLTISAHATAAPRQP